MPIFDVRNLKRIETLKISVAHAERIETPIIGVDVANSIKNLESLCTENKNKNTKH